MLLCGVHSLRRQLAAWDAGRPAGVVGDFLDVLRSPTDDFGSFLEEAPDVAHVAHWYRGPRLALDIARARTARQDEALISTLSHMAPALSVSGLTPVDVQTVPFN